MMTRDAFNSVPEAPEIRIRRGVVSMTPSENPSEPSKLLLTISINDINEISDAIVTRSRLLGEEPAIPPFVTSVSDYTAVLAWLQFVQEWLLDHVFDFLVFQADYSGGTSFTEGVKYDDMNLFWMSLRGDGSKMGFFAFTTPTGDATGYRVAQFGDYLRDETVEDVVLVLNTLSRYPLEGRLSYNTAEEIPEDNNRSASVALADGPGLLSLYNYLDAFPTDQKLTLSPAMWGIVSHSYANPGFYGGQVNLTRNWFSLKDDLPLELAGKGLTFDLYLVAEPYSGEGAVFEDYDLPIQNGVFGRVETGVPFTTGVNIVSDVFPDVPEILAAVHLLAVPAGEPSEPGSSSSVGFGIDLVTNKAYFVAKCPEVTI